MGIRLILGLRIEMGISKNKGTPKFIMENPIKVDDLGVPLFLETLIYWEYNYQLI